MPISELNIDEQFAMICDEEKDLRKQKALIQALMNVRTPEERAAIQSELDEHRDRPPRNPEDYKRQQE